VLVLFGLSSLIGILESASVSAIYPIVSIGLNIETGQGNVILTWIGSVAALLPVEDTFISFCLLFLILVFTAFLFKIVNTIFATFTASHIVVRNKEKLFRKQLQADYQYFLDNKLGGMMYTTVLVPGSIMQLLTACIRALSQAMLMIFIFALLFSISWLGAVLVIVAGVAYFFVMQYIGVKISYATGVGRAGASTRENIILTEVFSGIKQIKVFLTQRDWYNNFSSAVRQYFFHYRRGTVWGEIPAHIIMLMAFASVAVIGLVFRIQNPGGFTQLLPVFGTFVFALLRLLPPITELGGLRLRIMEALPNCEIAYNTLNREFDTIKDGQSDLGSFNSGIQFDHVFFSHKGRSKTIRDISITFEKSKTTAIVGPSGGGKTTIADLLLRLYDPDKGEIKIDGFNLKEYALSSWLSRIGFVSQDTFVFHDTVKNNIAFSPDKYSDEEIIEAAQAANAHNFILEFPQGYDTIVGERGMKLSGGQKQRIAIARAMVRKPEILILDEATSALDNVSEAMVQEAISKLSKNRTVIIIAHRLSTIINADKIVVLEDGQVKEEGTDAELRKKKGVYWNLYQVQEKVRKQTD